VVGVKCCVGNEIRRKRWVELEVNEQEQEWVERQVLEEMGRMKGVELLNREGGLVDVVEE